MCANYKYEVMELAEDYLYINTKKTKGIYCSSFNWEIV